MFFHIDESGNTGNYLFDKNQPRLSYGVLSAKTNVDALGRILHGQMLAKVGQAELHAKDLGVSKLTEIVPQLIQLQHKMKFAFDYYFIDKPAYALTLLFDAVFDAGLNEAVRWDHYWTPYRFILICKLTAIVDEELLKRSWKLCLSRRIHQQASEVVALLTELRDRLDGSELDERSKVIMADAFNFGITNPLSLDFGTSNQKIISPNAVGFQFVVGAMAERLRRKGVRDASSIVLDEQLEFNAAQIGTHYNLRMIGDGLKKASARDRASYIKHPLFEHIGADELTRKSVPRKSIVVKSGPDSIGLQIVDIYLWLANRLLLGRELSPELEFLTLSFLPKSFIDGVSIEGMQRRWSRFEAKLPNHSEITEEQLASAREFSRAHEDKLGLMGLREPAT